MKVLLRDRDSGLYFQGAGGWTRLLSEGINLETFELANEAAGACSQPNLVIVMSFDNGQRDLLVPVCKPTLPSAPRRVKTSRKLRAGQSFLDELAVAPSNTFEGKFLIRLTRLGLNTVLSGEEIHLLFDAALLGTFCNIAFNGLGGCNGEIKPERESRRLNLERAFTQARNAFYATAGWGVLPGTKRRLIEHRFLTVLVSEDKLARTS